MKSKRLTLSVLFVVAAVANALACTNLIVGKNASADGSTIVSYSADSYGLFGELYHYPAGMHKKGTLIDIHEWDTGKYLGQIEQARQTYNVIGNMNEFQLTIGETTFGGRPELVDTTGIIDYGSLIYLGLPTLTHRPRGHQSDDGTGAGIWLLQQWRVLHHRRPQRNHGLWR